MKKRFLFVSILFTLIASLIFFSHTSAIAQKTKPTGATPIVWKAQSAWVLGLGNQEDSVYFANMVNKLSGGRLVIDKMRSAGELMGSFETFSAVSQGKLDITGSGSSIAL